MCGSLGLPELLIVLAIVVLLFGASRLPQLGKALGETVKNFKKSSTPKDELSQAEQKDDTIEAHEVPQIVEGEEQERPRQGAAGADEGRKESAKVRRDDSERNS